MLVKITARRQVTLPARVLDALGVKPGDRIQLEETPDGFVLRARRISRPCAASYAVAKAVSISKQFVKLPRIARFGIDPCQ